jgi:hypothetical protein
MGKLFLVDTVKNMGCGSQSAFDKSVIVRVRFAANVYVCARAVMVSFPESKG